jgi:hypothetical protein
MNPTSPKDAPDPAPRLLHRKAASGDSLATEQAVPAAAPREIGGRKDGSEPTRFGDWEKNGRCVDF